MADSSTLDTLVAVADAQGIEQSVKLLQSGQTVALPTETVYGLGADTDNGEAVAKIYAAKGRPSFNPLITHVSTMKMAQRYGVFDALAWKLADHFWPGPLTLVVLQAPESPASALVTAGLPTIAIRMPAHPVMREVITQLGRGIAAPSANASGRLSPTRAEHVLSSLGGRIPLILDGGPCAAGLESSIVAVVDGKATMLRLGAISREEIAAVLGQDIPIAGEAAPITAPGMMLSHYAPRLPIRLNAQTACADEFHLGFGSIRGDETLSASGDTIEAAAHLFDALHRADASGKAGIAVAPIPDNGLGPAINDRLRRAAAG